MILAQRDVDNIRFSLDKAREDLYVFSARRISDDRHLRGQLMFKDNPSAYMDEMIAEWAEKNPGQNDEPPPVYCLACNLPLEADHDTNYQFDNALWIGFHGGYGMFVDNMEFPSNMDLRWLPDGTQNPNYVPEYEEKKILPGRPDYEAIICHTCAHALCDAVPWIDQLLQPLRSHAHRTKHIPELMAQGHRGWDLDRQREAERPT